jgi:plasmid stability protein
MSDVLIRDIEPTTLDRIKAKAKRNHRSVQAELRRIIEAAADDLDISEELELMRSIRASIGPQKTNSVDLIREDRNR